MNGGKMGCVTSRRYQSSLYSGRFQKKTSSHLRLLLSLLLIVVSLCIHLVLVVVTLLPAYGGDITGQQTRLVVIYDGVPNSHTSPTTMSFEPYFSENNKKLLIFVIELNRLVNE